jgi:hypothetical protein
MWRDGYGERIIARSSLITSSGYVFATETMDRLVCSFPEYLRCSSLHSGAE